MAPQRIQLRRSKGWRMPANTVKVDRSTRFGNPTVCTPHNCSLAPCGCCGAGERCCVAVFREYVESGLAGRPSSTGSLAIALDAQAGYPRRTRLVESLPALRGKNLACWCKPGAPCHADVLLELANAPDDVGSTTLKEKTMKLSDLRAGDTIQADGGFTCMSSGSKAAMSDEHGLYVECSDGHHYLDGQEDEDGTLVGFSSPEFG